MNLWELAIHINDLNISKDCQRICGNFYSLQSAASKPLDSKCAQAVNPDIVKHWFDLVKEHTKIGLMQN